MAPRVERMALTADLVAQVERIEPDPGPELGETEHTDAEIDAVVAELLGRHRPEELWVFAYGSLIWNLEFEFVEQRYAVAAGWHRSFCLWLTRWRGTREQPALMLALDRGGSCTGIAFRLPRADHTGQLAKLVRREIDGNPPTNVPRWISVRTPQGKVRALAFVAAPVGKAYAGKLPLSEVATILACAAGHWGSAAQYLFRTVTMLEDHNIRDRNLWQLQALVAARLKLTKARTAKSHLR